MHLVPKLRVARPTDDLNSLIRFYRDGLGLKVLYQFKDHEGFDGVIIGAVDAPYHFEFTRAHGHSVGRAPTKDHLLVFYEPDLPNWQDSIDRMRGAGFAPVPSFNPYWDRHGKTFEDPDSYRVVIYHDEWTI